MIRALFLKAAFLATAIVVAGCASSPPKITADKPGIAQLERLGMFTWRGAPSYMNTGGGGIAGNVYSMYSSASGELRKNLKAMRESGVYEKFEARFIEKFSGQLGGKIEAMDKEKRVYKGSGNERRVDAQATARAQGYDALLEATVWPSMYEKFSPALSSVALKIELTMTRMSDKKILWSTSYKTQKRGQYVESGEVAELVTPAVDQAFSLYSQSP